MRIDTSGLYASSRPTSNTEKPTSRPQAAPLRDSGPVNVSVSPRARLLALGREALAKTPDVRRPVVDAARARLGARDAFEGSTIARAMIDTITEDAA